MLQFDPHRSTISNSNCQPYTPSLLLPRSSSLYVVSLSLFALRYPCLFFSFSFLLRVSHEPRGKLRKTTRWQFGFALLSTTRYEWLGKFGFAFACRWSFASPHSIQRRETYGNRIHNSLSEMMMWETHGARFTRGSRKNGAISTNRTTYAFYSIAFNCFGFLYHS